MNFHVVVDDATLHETSAGVLLFVCVVGRHLVTFGRPVRFCILIRFTDAFRPAAPAPL